MLLRIVVFKLFMVVPTEASVRYLPTHSACSALIRNSALFVLV